MSEDGLRPLAETSTAWPARKVVRGLGLRDGGARHPGRPRVVADMVSTADGRTTLDGRSVGLGNPADRALLRELRASVDAVLVGTTTLAAERYADLIDDDQRERRVRDGLEPEPIVATISRALDLPTDLPLFSEPDARVQIYTEAEGEVPAQGAWVACQRFESGTLTIPRVLEHLLHERGARAVLCEGGPRLLRELVVADCLDDLLLTVSPLLVAGGGHGALAGPPVEPPTAMRLRAVRRAGEHLFLHYAL